MIEDSTRLQETYPGENAQQIEQLQASVVENWGVLQDKAAQRKDDLLAVADMHRFLADVSLKAAVIKLNGNKTFEYDFVLVLPELSNENTVFIW